LATKYYRQAYAQSPDSYVSLVMNLVVRHKVAEAVEICRNEIRTKPGKQPALALASAILSANISPDELKQAEPFLAEAVQQYSDDSQLLLAVSGLQYLQGNLEEVIRLNRQILAHDPQNLLALNNLSSLLSERPEHLAEALQLIERAIQQDAHNPTLLDTKA